MAQITYADKSNINTSATPAQNKVSDTDMNEIKSVVNANDTLMGNLTTLNTSTKTSIVAAINEVNSKQIVYSTSEVDTGEKWIDNRTIYRKSFSIPLTDGSSSVSYNHSITADKIWIDQSNSFVDFLNDSKGVDSYYNGSTWMFTQVNGTSINCEMGGSFANISNKILYITLRYVKS